MAAAAQARLKQLQWGERECALMAPSAEASPWSLVSGFTEALAHAHLWEVAVGDQRALVAVRGEMRSGGHLLSVVGLRSIGERITPEGVAAIERLAREVYAADLLSMSTRHAHLVRTCERAGWTAVARIVNKPLRLQ